MKYVLSPESDALEAFPARPCNIYVLLVTSRIAKSHFSGRSANTLAILFREYEGNTKECLECTVIYINVWSRHFVSNESGTISNDEQSNL